MEKDFATLLTALEPASGSWDANQDGITAEEVKAARFIPAAERSTEDNKQQQVFKGGPLYRGVQPFSCIFLCSLAE